MINYNNEALTREAGEQVAQRGLGGGAEAGRRLVEEQHVGTAQQGAGDGCPLPLPAREKRPRGPNGRGVALREPRRHLVEP